MGKPTSTDHNVVNLREQEDVQIMTWSWNSMAPTISGEFVIVDTSKESSKNKKIKKGHLKGSLGTCQGVVI